LRIEVTQTCARPIASAELFVKVYVYHPQDAPLTGIWTQEGARKCEGMPGQFDSDHLFGELDLRANGEFLLTRKPFETYDDFGEATSWRTGPRSPFPSKAATRSPRTFRVRGYALKDKDHLELMGLYLGASGGRT